VTESTQQIAADVVIFRIGGGTAENLALRASETLLNPPGISAFRGGTPAEAAETMRRRFPRMAPRGRTVVGAATAGQIRAAGFDVIMNATRHYPQHIRLIHPDGAAGFTKENLERLARCFTNHTGL
jgi:hypothetical protein